MSITAYVGLPGSGKSYGVTEHVLLPALREQRRVVTNIPLNLSEIEREFPGANVAVVSTDDICKEGWWAALVGGEVVILDEVWRLWPSGMKASQASDEHKSALAEHRHKVGSDGKAQQICLVTQDLAQLSSWVRLLVEETYRAVKLTAVGQEKRFRVDIYSGAVTGQAPPESRRIRQVFGEYKSEVYRFYQSHTKSLTGMAGIETKVDRRANLLRSPMIIFGMPLGLLALVLGSCSTYQQISGGGGGVSYVSSSPGVTQQSTNGSTAGAPGSVQAKPLLSADWRVSGELAGYIILTGHLGRYIRVPLRDARCTRQYDEWQCTINGALVTGYSGPVEQDGIFQPLKQFVEGS
jgi:zona occludens toxin